jgi:phenylpropionate dioxygenase-like ring-hydroxylating dioxygenase large terminal subunit
MVDLKWTALPVPHAVTLPDRVPKERYFDPEFYELEAELLWPRVWQMACRLEEIPGPSDFVEYEILDQSVVVVRNDEGKVQAFQNACRHRGVKLAEGRGTLKSGFTCPFHGWCYGTDGENTFVTQRRMFSEHNLEPAELNLVPVRTEVWGGSVWINFDDDAPPLRTYLEPIAGILDAWKVESLRTEWWYACHVPANWKLVQEAFVEQYHVLETHPQLRIPGRFPPRKGQPFDPKVFVEAELQYLQMMCEGMAGMVHADDVRIAEGMRDIELPADYNAAVSAWNRALNSAVTDWHRKAGHDVPDLNDLDDQSFNEPMAYCFPHYIVLPMYSSASAYRFRPLGPEETLMEIWSLSRTPKDEGSRPTPPEVWAHDDERWPPIPTQDFSNLERQQRGLHGKGFRYMRLSQLGEGHISNYQRMIDGFLAGLPYEKLLPAMSKINVHPLEQPVLDVPL